MPTLYDNIPAELKQRPQWIVWKAEADAITGKVIKRLYQVSGYPASVTKPDNWATFEQVLACAERYNGIGYVFAADDPYCGIDLDNAQKHSNADWQFRRQMEVYERFQSYTERSPSKEGCHIIIKANIGKGVRDGALEIYSQERYFTFTGDVIRDLPIVDYQDLAMALKSDLRPDDYDGDAELPDDVPEIEPDQVIIDRGCNAANKAKFIPLWKGHWQVDFNHKANQQGTASSEADCAFMNMLYCYTQNHAQCKRIFLASGLSRPKYTGKYSDYYLNMLIAKAADGKTKHDVSMIDWSAFQTQSGAAQAMEEPATAPESAAVTNDALADRMDAIAAKFKYEPPSGLLGDIAQFIYNQAPRPVAEIALGGAIGLMAGICGKAYNVSATGLNQYVLILAGTGTGKEAAMGGITKLITAVATKVPVAKEFLGPEQIASQQALINYLEKNPCCVSVLGEFGLTLQQMSGMHANSNDIGLRKIFLKLYNRSGATDIFQQMIYANNQNNTHVIHAPAYSVLGESTPERFYETLSEEMISEGFLPRFSIIEYKGGRPLPNREHASVRPSEALVNDLASLCAGVKASMASSAVTNVTYTNDAAQLLQDFEDYADTHQQGDAVELTKALWNRAHLKALKMSALIAVGNHYTNPVIDLAAAEWAIGLAIRDIAALEQKFLDGEIGRSLLSTDEQKQIDAVIRAVSQWLHNPFEEYAKYGGTIEMHNAHMILHENVQRRIVGQSYFKSDRLGPTYAINKAFKTLCEWGYLEEVIDKTMLKNTFGHARRTFAVIDKGKFAASLSVKARPGRKGSYSNSG